MVTLSTSKHALSVLENMKQFTHEDDAFEGVIILRTNSFRFSPVPPAEEEPGHDVEEDGGQDGGCVPDSGEADPLAGARSLEAKA